MGRTLYRLEGCPYCEVVVDVLDELELPFESVWVEGMHSNRNEVRRVSGQRQVPVLVDEEYGVTMAESVRIIEYLQTTHGDAASPSEVELDF
ncbi:glutathione S-transferase N-terminal domain-containing protein [Halovivax sp.]|uniref:glutathione S-transferase N-terminal domain-containing protein n=1 Tax=Halovivax sp. TaxID=1935978 RepID=UPI0025BDADB3|nr:glutathione S-transferase N-terminal domain-containing protein [Halovivax sp.]